jgi:flagellar motor switch protein FliM
LAWRDLMHLTFNVVSREENMQFAAFVDGDDMIVNCSFMVQLPDAEPASFDILYPFQTLKPISTAAVAHAIGFDWKMMPVGASGWSGR